MYEVYAELKKLLKKEKITVIDFCNNILKKSKASLFRLFKEKRIRTDLNEDELGILETIESWIIRQNVTSVVEFEESTKRNRPNASHKNGLLKENFSDELNIQNVRLNMDKLKRKLKERLVIKSKKNKKRVICFSHELLEVYQGSRINKIYSKCEY